MKILKDLNIDPLKINELQDYADLKDLDLDKEIKDILENGVEALYKKLVPKDRQILIEKKIERMKKKQKAETPKPLSEPKVSDPVRPSIPSNPQFLNGNKIN